MDDGVISGAMEKVNPYYYAGAIVGGIAGYVIAKIYMIWAMVYIEGGYDRFTGDEWNPGSTPLWVTATEHPSAFTFWITVIFIVIGILLVKLCRAAAERERIAKTITHEV